MKNFRYFSTIDSLSSVCWSPNSIDGHYRASTISEQGADGFVVRPSLFCSPQDSHLPCQRLYAAPQFWQTRERVFLAMKG